MVIRRMWHFYASDNSYRCRVSRGWICGDLSHAWTSGVWFDSLIITKPKLTCSLALAELIDRGRFDHKASRLKGVHTTRILPTTERQLECKIQRDCIIIITKRSRDPPDFNFIVDISFRLSLIRTPSISESYSN